MAAGAFVLQLLSESEPEPAYVPPEGFESDFGTDHETDETDEDDLVQFGSDVSLPSWCTESSHFVVWSSESEPEGDRESEREGDRESESDEDLDGSFVCHGRRTIRSSLLGSLLKDGREDFLRWQ